MSEQAFHDQVSGIAPEELEEWYESLEDILHRYGEDKLKALLVCLQERAYARGVKLPFTANTPYINTIHHTDQVKFPAIGRSNVASRATFAGTRWRWLSARISEAA